MVSISNLFCNKMIRVAECDPELIVVPAFQALHVEFPPLPLSPDSRIFLDFPFTASSFERNSRDSRADLGLNSMSRDHFRSSIDIAPSDEYASLRLAGASVIPVRPCRVPG